MSVFDLKLNENDLNDDKTRCSGNINICEFSENFSSSLRTWSAADYRSSWVAAIKLLINTNFSVFFLDVDAPDKSEFFLGYTAFCLDDIVYLQNMMFLRDQFDLREIFRLEFKKRPSLMLVNEDGERVSTWTCPVDSMMKYLQRIR